MGERKINIPMWVLSGDSAAPTLMENCGSEVTEPPYTFLRVIQWFQGSIVSLRTLYFPPPQSGRRKWPLRRWMEKCICKRVKRTSSLCICLENFMCHLITWKQKEWVWNPDISGQHVLAVIFLYKILDKHLLYTSFHPKYLVFNFLIFWNAGNYFLACLWFPGYSFLLFETEMVSASK